MYIEIATTDYANELWLHGRTGSTGSKCHAPRMHAPRMRVCGFRKIEAMSYSSDLVLLLKKIDEKVSSCSEEDFFAKILLECRIMICNGNSRQIALGYETAKRLLERLHSG